jgi:DNA (cytosine-5)-methyltransferase 1
MKKINYLDLFSGCGGLSYHFLKDKRFNLISSADNDLACHNTYLELCNSLGIKNSDKKVLKLDLNKNSNLINNFSGINLDLVIGGPPCQAYSMAGRIRDKNKMKDDYRNYLFESFLKVIQLTKAKYFIMENVPGILSAKPGGILITSRIKKAIQSIGFYVKPEIADCLIELSNYQIPQRRRRIIIFGISKKINNYKNKVDKFYSLLSSLKIKNQKSVYEAIGDLKKFYPSPEIIKKDGKKYSHFPISSSIFDHFPRYHSKRDIGIFEKLSHDIESNQNKFTDINQLKKLYSLVVKKKSNVHKYYVLRKNELSNLIPAHLYKDGLRHIHYDSKQARTLTVREAARLQTFPDNFKFIGSNTDKYKMIGNAVPPLFSKYLLKAFLQVI